MTRAALVVLAAVLAACGSDLAVSPTASSTPTVAEVAPTLGSLDNPREFLLGRLRSGSPTLSTEEWNAGPRYSRVYDAVTAIDRGDHVVFLIHGGTNPRSFQVWGVDGAGFYLAEDHGAEGRGWSYVIENSYWFSRSMPLGQPSVQTSAYLTNYDPSCVTKARGAWGVDTGPYPFVVSLIAHEFRDVGGVLGRQEVIVLLYAGNEEFTFSRDYGLIGWRARRENVGGYWNRPTASPQLEYGPSCWEARR